MTVEEEMTVEQRNDHVKAILDMLVDRNLTNREFEDVISTLLFSYCRSEGEGLKIVTKSEGYTYTLSVKRD